MMDKIPLRTYLKEIENLVDKSENDQAIAHCRHILKSYPKNVATYRLLGKAFLESRRYGDAADVFQRVLSGVPDDFVSHVGMSIIREDEGNQDAAIWHMERAFEIQPYNSAIQDELRRLYGRRDGLEPPKVRLTRGALARMYARGNLYQQAIGELRAALAEDPQRSDLQVMLARMYFMAGQKVEAVETCSSLLKRLPYCLEANRIISAILPETERKEESQVYRERVMALDPYLVLASPFETNADNVRDQVVVINKLAYQEGLLEEASQPAWAASLGVSFDEFKSGEESVPDWLQAIAQGPATKKGEARPVLEQPESLAEATSQASSLFPEEAEELPSWMSFPDQATASGEEKSATEIPDWMEAAGWEASRGTAQGALPPFEYPEEGETDISDISKAELPPWLQTLAPEGLDLSATASDEDSSLEFMPWLQESGSDRQSTAGEAEPEWMAEMGEQPEGATPPVPDWLGELGEAGQDITQAEAEQEIPEWLKEPQLVASEVVPEIEQPAIPKEEVHFELPLSEVEPAEEMPDWLKEIEGAPVQEEVTEDVLFTAFEITAETPPEAEPAEEAPEWLAEFAPEQAVSEEELVGELEASGEIAAEAEPAEEMPDWLKEIEGAPAQGEIGEEVPLTTFESAAETPLEAVPAEEAPEWVAELATEQAVSEEEPAEAIPTWLQELGVSPLEIAPSEGEAELEDLASTEGEPAQFEEMPEWLKSFEEKPAVAKLLESELEPGDISSSLEEAEPADEIPDWIKELSKGQSEEIEMGVELEPPSGEATSQPSATEGAEELDWLQIIGEKPMGSESAFILEETESGTASQEDYSPEDLEALLADTQPVRLGEAAPVVPFNEILEEIDAGMQVEAQADQETQQAAAEKVEFTFDGTDKEAFSLWEEVDTQAEFEAEEKVIEELEPTVSEVETFQVELSEIEASPAEEGTLTEIGSETAQEIPPFELDDQQVSLAWLESLAAKHGVAEEQLFTKPEDRPTEAPAWIEQELAGPVEAAEIAETTEPGEFLEPDLMIEEVVFEDIGPGDQIEADAFTVPEESKEALPAEQALLEEELVEEKPDWLKALQAEDTQEPTTPAVPEIGSEVESVQAEGQEIAAAELPDWLRAVQKEADQELAQRQKEQEAEAPAAPGDTDAAMAWLESLAAKQGVPEEELFTPLEQRSETPPEWVEELTSFEPAVAERGIEPAIPEIEYVEELQVAESQGESPAEVAEGEPVGIDDEIAAREVETPGREEPELPEWLAGAELEEAQEEAWSPPVEPVKAALRAPRHGTAPLSQPPTEPVNINKASLVDLEVLPGVGFILAQNILTYREAFGQYASVDDLIKVPGIMPGILAEIRDYLMVPAAEQVPTVLEPEVLAEAQSELIIARNRLAEGDVEGTVAQYTKLIKQSELLPEIIRDLKEALYRFPVDISLWQTLGDAYLRSDQLSEALEAYTKAEELLR